MRLLTLFQMFLNTKLMGLMATKSAVEEILELSEQRYAEMLAEPNCCSQDWPT
jgi:hypothetical protein